jgi:hypothetical protein
VSEQDGRLWGYLGLFGAISRQQLGAWCTEWDSVVDGRGERCLGEDTCIPPPTRNEVSSPGWVLAPHLLVQYRMLFSIQRSHYAG